MHGVVARTLDLNYVWGTVRTRRTAPCGNFTCFDVRRKGRESGRVPTALPVLNVSTPVRCPPLTAGIMTTGAVHVALRMRALGELVGVRSLALVVTSGDIDPECC